MLELILTAPVVVARWISLQYYGSTVAPDVFGGGNQLLHNVTGGIGVVEGNGGAGLPWQSVHDGERYAHEPLRLSVCVEAPREAMAEILGRHNDVRALFDNGWLTSSPWTRAVAWLGAMRTTSNGPRCTNPKPPNRALSGSLPPETRRDQAQKKCEGYFG